MLYPYFRQNVVLLPPPLFFASDMKTRKNHWGGGGAENTPTLQTNVTRGDEYCSPRHSKLRHPVLYPCSGKKECSLPPPPPRVGFFASDTQQQQQQQQALFS